MTSLDLHVHGPIDFDPRWLISQGYKPESLLIDLVETSFSKGLDAFSIISAYDIRLRSTVLDRFKHLCKLSKYLPKDYNSEILGDNILLVEREEKRVLIINGQSVNIRENGEVLESLVVGSNSVPEGGSIKDTSAYCRDNGLIFVAEHVMSQRSGGIGLERLEKHLKDYTAVEGHNSQLTFRFPFSHFPILNQYARCLNREVQKYCNGVKKPWIATSDAHRIKDVGKSHIIIEPSLNLSDGGSVIQDIREAVESNSFKTVCEYESLFGWFSWTSTLLRRGITD